MKMIDVLNKMVNGEIKRGTVLSVYDNNNEMVEEYRYVGNCFIDDYAFPLTLYGGNDLNKEVVLTEPKPVNKKYQLKLFKADDLSYITRSSSRDNDFNYDVGNKTEIYQFITKFSQEEIDNDRLLKFVEMYGVKEEVEVDED